VRASKGVAGKQKLILFFYALNLIDNIWSAAHGFT
jgi:hypothetical protein